MLDLADEAALVLDVVLPLVLELVPEAAEPLDFVLELVEELVEVPELVEELVEALEPDVVVAAAEDLLELLVEAALVDELPLLEVEVLEEVFEVLEVLVDEPLVLVVLEVLETLCDDGTFVLPLLGSNGFGVNKGITYSTTKAAKASTAAAPMILGSGDFLRFAGASVLPVEE